MAGHASAPPRETFERMRHPSIANAWQTPGRPTRVLQQQTLRNCNVATRCDGGTCRYLGASYEKLMSAPSDRSRRCPRAE
jgi:hypothetical protein